MIAPEMYQKLMVSFVRRHYETETRSITLDEVFEAIRTGAHGLKEKVTQCRNKYEMELALTGDVKLAKKAIAEVKAEFPGFLASGVFSKRDNGSLVRYSGLLMLDLDDIGDAGELLKSWLKKQDWCLAVMFSPSGHGLKILVATSDDPVRHEDYFRAYRQLIVDETGFEIDAGCKDLARITYFPYDPELWENPGEIVPIKPADPLPRGKQVDSFTTGTGLPNLAIRQQIAIEVAAEHGRTIDWVSADIGYLRPCPKEEDHGNKNGPKDCIVWLLPNEKSPSPTFYCVHMSCRPTIEAMNFELRSKIGKAEFVPDPNFYRHHRQGDNGKEEVEGSKITVEFLTPSNIKSYEPPENLFMVGDCHIMRAATSVMAGAPGVGKSRWLFELANCGATQKDFFGLKVHRKFKTLIIQNENGRYRMSQQFKTLDCTPLDDFIRITPPPPYGLCFGRKEFREQVKAAIEQYQFDLIGIDPWNAVAKEQDSREYLETFETIRSVMPRGDDAPALVILCHTRKPKTEERANGRALLHLVAGSYVMGSVPRCVWVMQHASSDTTETVVVLTCCKNNDGELGPRSAWDWDEETGVHIPVSDFDWDEFDLTEKERHAQITQSDVEAVLKNTPMKASDAVKALETLTKKSKRTCQRALNLKGKFSNHLAENKDGLIMWVK